MKKQEIRRASKGNQGVLCAPNQNDLPVQEVILIFAIIPTGEMVAGEDFFHAGDSGRPIIPTGAMAAGEGQRHISVSLISIMPGNQTRGLRIHSACSG